MDPCKTAIYDGIGAPGTRSGSRAHKPITTGKSIDESTLLCEG